MIDTNHAPSSPVWGEIVVNQLLSGHFDDSDHFLAKLKQKNVLLSYDCTVAANRR